MFHRARPRATPAPATCAREVLSFFFTFLILAILPRLQFLTETRLTSERHLVFIHMINAWFIRCSTYFSIPCCATRCRYAVGLPAAPVQATRVRPWRGTPALPLRPAPPSGLSLCAPSGIPTAISVPSHFRPSVGGGSGLPPPLPRGVAPPCPQGGAFSSRLLGLPPVHMFMPSVIPCPHRPSDACIVRLAVWASPARPCRGLRARVPSRSGWRPPARRLLPCGRWRPRG